MVSNWLRSSTICRVALLGDLAADNAAFISENVIRETCSFYGARETRVLRAFDLFL
jgi:hypothetical protein